MPDRIQGIQVAQATDTAPSPTPKTTSPTASPTPTPSPTPAEIRVTRTVAEEAVELPGLRDLPFKKTLAVGIELVVLLIFYIAVRNLFQRFLHRGTETLVKQAQAGGNLAHVGRIRALSTISLGIVQWTLGFLAVVAALSAVGINVGPILGTASVVGIAVGLGAQQLAKDLITGSFILLEDQYVVGDYVTIGTVTGTVEELGMRVTRIRDDEGKLHYIANGNITQVANHSRGPVASMLDIAIAPTADPNKAADVLQSALQSAVADLGLPDTPSVVGITAADSTKTVLRIAFNAPPTQRPAVLAPKLRQRARAALLAADIAPGGP